jgi:hypothetical protein
MGIGDGSFSGSIAVNSTNGVGVLYRGADSGGTVYSFVESAPPVGSSFGHADAGDPDTFTITLTTPSNLSSQSWNVSFSDTLGNLGGTESESFSPGANSSLWTEIYLIQDGAQNGDALNFSLVTVPEPAREQLGLVSKPDCPFVQTRDIHLAIAHPYYASPGFGASIPSASAKS